MRSGQVVYLQWRAGQLPGQTWWRPTALAARRTFNGGPGNCPAKPMTPMCGPLTPLGLQWRAGQLPGQTGLGWRRRRGSCTLQWRAGQLPGQTASDFMFTAVRLGPSMEGRAIARPNLVQVSADQAGDLPFNGGPGNCPAKPTGTVQSRTGKSDLQWRAGQLPGQTGGWRVGVGHQFTDLQWRAGQLPGQTNKDGTVTLAEVLPSMEGRAIARPNRWLLWCYLRRQYRLQWRAGQLPGQTLLIGGRSALVQRPSMEGRAIARPNWAGPADSGRERAPFNGGPGNCPAKLRPQRQPESWTATFNGGPGNCPAKPDQRRPRLARRDTLQWRAGQLPGQTPTAQRPCGRLYVPSMEGRAIARPNMVEGCPLCQETDHLQWRAGQLPGQTSCCWPSASARRSAFNGGPGNCPAKPEGMWRNGEPGLFPSMEGRAIARPNRKVGEGRHVQADPSMEGRAIARPNPARRTLRSTRRSSFNGGPGNCPAKPIRATIQTHESCDLQWRAGQLPGQTRR